MYRWNRAQSISRATAFALVAGTATASASDQPRPPPGPEPNPDTGDRIETLSVLPEPDNWVDSSHGYLTDQANALTRWVDDFFGDQETDLEQAESRLRLRFIEDWDETLGNNLRVRIGGKVNLPKMSRRLDLVFRGDDPDDDIAGRQDPAQSPVGLQYQLGDQETRDNHRFDLTIGLSSAGPRPGARYRYTGAFSDKNPVRFTQRVQYEFDDGAFATSRLDLDHRLNDYSLLRSFSRVFWGEESEGAEWSTAIAHAARWSSLRGRERATFVYAGLSGKTKPYHYTDNYFIGARYRIQAYRDYLVFEVEPSYNWRIDEPFMDRRGALKLELRLELLLDDRLRRDAGFAQR